MGPLRAERDFWRHLFDRLDEEVADAGDVLTENIHDLRDRVDEIDTIVRAIDAVAGQIDLLALNADIEAARTTTGGEGFAVVADEIKDLAEPSKAEACEIEGIVSAITENIETTAEIVDAANDRVRDEVDEIETLMTNQESIIETSVGTGDIAAATNERSESAEEVTSTLDDAVSGVDGDREARGRERPAGRAVGGDPRQHRAAGGAHRTASE